MSDLIDTTEMYLRTIYELLEDGVVPMRARIAEQLGHTGPTVSQTVARMERDGLVVVSPDDRRLELTEQGRSIAVRVMRKHRLAERLLTDVIGLDLLHVHDEACRWEHVMSDRVERRLLEILDSPERSPYGNAVPGLDELGAPPAAEYPAGAVSVHDLASTGGGRATLVRLGEHAQTAPGLLDAAAAAGLTPGSAVTVGPLAEEIVLEGPDGAVVLAENTARHIFVLAVED